MEHDFYFDGNPKRIAWSIKSGQNIAEQFREHVETYFEKVSSEQSKYIALHVGIFWAIGTFIIKNNDVVNIMIDSRNIYESMMQKIENNDELIKNKIRFIFHLISLRGLKVKFSLINTQNNMATHML